MRHAKLKEDTSPQGVMILVIILKVEVHLADEMLPVAQFTTISFTISESLELLEHQRHN